MADVNETFACPLCLETLQKPIRITACGHNFCQGCLESLCRSANQANCPTCRRENAVRKNAITDLARNFLLEEAVEKMTISAKPAPKVVQVLSGDVITQLTDKAEFLISEQQHAEALDILQTIIVQADGKQLIMALITKVQCLLAINQDAVSTSEVMMELVEKEKFTNEKVLEKIYKDIKSLIKKFTEIENFKTSLSLHHCLIHLTGFYRQGIEKLQKFVSLGSLIHNIAKEAMKQNLLPKFEENMEEILHEMQLISDVELKEKMRQIAWFLFRYGLCCDDAERYVQAVELYKQTICLMKSAFGDEANRYHVFGDCHNNIGVSYEHLNQLVDARNMYRKSLAAYEHVRDCLGDGDKTGAISRASRNLQRIEAKLSTTND